MLSFDEFSLPVDFSESCGIIFAVSVVVLTSASVRKGVTVSLLEYTSKPILFKYIFPHLP